jgi:hypothetical protein
MINLYTKIDLLTEEYRSKVFPLLFDLCYARKSSLTKWYRIEEDLKKSDIAVWPLEFDFSMKFFKNTFHFFLVDARCKNKKIWIYSGGDYGFSINEKDIYNFRLGGFKSNLTDNDFVLPSFISDPYLGRFKSFKTLKKKYNPKIGFVGHASEGTLKLFKELWHYFRINFKRIFKKTHADYQSFYPSSNKRYYYLKKLSANNKIKNEFILRKNYRAGVNTEEERQRTSMEFYQNIFDCPYTFCMRGNGNFSVRLFETLAMGRIPLFLNTDSKLPLDEDIDWNKHVVWVEQKDGQVLDKKLLHFHKNISQMDFEKIQSNNRILWDKYLTKHGYFKHIHDKFVNKI